MGITMDFGVEDVLRCACGAREFNGLRFGWTLELGFGLVAVCGCGGVAGLGTERFFGVGSGFWGLAWSLMSFGFGL